MIYFLLSSLMNCETLLNHMINYMYNMIINLKENMIYYKKTTIYYHLM